MRADLLHIVVAYFNPYRWNARSRLHREFMARYEKEVPIYVVELALGDRDFEVTDPTNPRHLQLRSEYEVPWIKENLLNIGMRTLLPADAKYVAWVDGDVRFENPRWVTETLHELQHAPIVQMFSHCMDVGPSWQAIPQEKSLDDYIRTSFIKVHNDKRGCWDPSEPYSNGAHCGYAWAANLWFLRKLDIFNPLIDFSIVGSADWMMACCFAGMPNKAAHGHTTDGYKRRIQVFHHRCEMHLKGNISHVPGLLLHHWHGRKRDRKYVSRWQVPLDHKFDPDLDLAYRPDGLLQYSGRNPRLMLDVRRHSRSKNEDSIDTE